MAALQELDADPEVDVIVIARGGGSVEDLLPFSNESPAASRRRRPHARRVSAIGHDVDTPLLDHVADWRASTPTDAGKRVVPDAQPRSASGIRQAAATAAGAPLPAGSPASADTWSRSARGRSWPTPPP